MPDASFFNASDRLRLRSDTLLRGWEHEAMRRVRRSLGAGSAGGVQMPLAWSDRVHAPDTECLPFETCESFREPLASRRMPVACPPRPEVDRRRGVVGFERCDRRLLSELLDPSIP